MNNDELLIAIKELFDKKIEEVKNHTGVLLEKFGSDIKTIAEGHDIINRKIDEKASELKDEISSLKSDMGVVKDYVIAVDEKLNEHDVMLKRVK